MNALEFQCTAIQTKGDASPLHLPPSPMICWDNWAVNNLPGSKMGWPARVTGLPLTLESLCLFKDGALELQCASIFSYLGNHTYSLTLWDVSYKSLPPLPGMTLIHCSYCKKNQSPLVCINPHHNLASSSSDGVHKWEEKVQSRAFLCSFILEGSESLEMDYRTKTLRRPLWLQTNIKWLEGLLLEKVWGQSPQILT